MRSVSSSATPPLVILNAVGLTGRLLPKAPRLTQLANVGWTASLREVIPAVTCTAQATLLTGTLPEQHGIVANGWLTRDSMEVRFWQQSNRLIQREPLYATAKRLAARTGRPLTVAKLFWWFNQGAAVDWSVTPKPWYGADGNKAFGISSKPATLSSTLESRHGRFPFQTFWGPGAGLPCTEWIGKAAADVLSEHRPDLTLVYLPHLDYDPQRYGPQGCDMNRLVAELDSAAVPILDAARFVGADVWVVSEYGHVDVDQPLFPNRWLREAGLLTTRDGPFGENVELFESRAVAVCDHQLCHVYVNDPADIPRVGDLMARQPGVASVLHGQERQSIGLDHPRAGDLVLLSTSTSWFAYSFWLDDRRAPDFARTVDIHRKIGFDPCEMFFDPNLRWGKGRAIGRLIQKKLGFRTLFDVVPLDPRIVHGSHGLPAADPLDRPILIGTGTPPVATSPDAIDLPMTAVRNLVLQRLGLDSAES